MEGLLLVSRDPPGFEVWERRWVRCGAGLVAVFAADTRMLERSFALPKSLLKAQPGAADVFVALENGAAVNAFRVETSDERLDWLRAFDSAGQESSPKSVQDLRTPPRPSFVMSEAELSPGDATAQAEREADELHRLITRMEVKPDDSVRILADMYVSKVREMIEWMREMSPTVTLTPSIAPQPPPSPHPITLQLTRKNRAFQRFPVLADAPAARAALPSLHDPSDGLPIWKLIRSSIGKNLAHIALPVDLCLPLSMLQMNVEFMQGEELLRRANREADAGRRHLLAFAAIYAGLADLAYRTKKPFNPVLGETYELVTPHFRLLAEQMQHHPPRCAFHVESADYSMQGTCQVMPYCKLTGVEMTFEFDTTLQLLASGDRFSFRFPSVSFHNLFVGKFYLWLNGRLDCVNVQSNATASVRFLPWSAVEAQNFRVEGALRDDVGRTLFELSGQWDRDLYAAEPLGQPAEVVRRGPPIPDHERQYRFTAFTLQMNHVTPELVTRLPCTDTRLRPDLRAFEHGDFALAEEEKGRVEQKQRALRKKRQAAGEVWRPLWFDPVEGDASKVAFNHRYWACRASGQWPESMPDIFS